MELLCRSLGIVLGTGEDSGERLPSVPEESGSVTWSLSLGV